MQYAYLLHSVFLAKSRPLLALESLCQAKLKGQERYESVLVKRAVKDFLGRDKLLVSELPVDKERAIEKLEEQAQAVLRRRGEPLTIYLELELQESSLFLEFISQDGEPQVSYLLHLPKASAPFLADARLGVRIEDPPRVAMALAKCGFCLHQAGLSQSALAILRLALKWQAEHPIAKPSFDALVGKGIIEREGLYSQMEAALCLAKVVSNDDFQIPAGAWWFDYLSDRLEAHLETLH